jgi:hypothetical protein
VVDAAFLFIFLLSVFEGEVIHQDEKK